MVYPPGPIIAPTGAELVSVDNGSAIDPRATLRSIAALGGGGSGQVVNTAITTAGAGTLTAAGIAGGLITRTGPTGAFNDTTATALAIVAAIPGAFVGQSFYLSIKNSTAFAETLLAGAGVTLPTATIVPANSTGTYLVTLTSLTAVALVHVDTPLTVGITPAQFTTAALSAGVTAVASLVGAAFVVLQNTGATPGNQTTPTAAAMLAAWPSARVGMSYILRIVNTAAGTLTLVADGSVTLTGTATVAQNVFRDYCVTFNTATTATFQSIGSGVSP